MYWVLRVRCGSSGHVNASQGLSSNIFTGFGVIAILRLKHFRLFVETAVRSKQQLH